MDYLPLKRKSSPLEPTFYQSKRAKKESEDLLSLALSQQLHITDAESRIRAFSEPQPSAYDCINDTLREAVLEARHIRNNLNFSQGVLPDRYSESTKEGGMKYDATKDKEDIEKYYNSINLWLKSVQFSNGPNYHV